jgi:hypothetical protein
MKPIRVQRKRTKGWKMPENTVYVGRPTKWGNPYKVSGWFIPQGEIITNPFNPKREMCKTHQQAVDLYKSWVRRELEYKRLNIKDITGKNLSCFCPLDKPCHVDVLLEIANS